jgi:hypothetical protein
LESAALWRSGVRREREGTGMPEKPLSTEAIGTLVWLLDSSGIDRSRYRVLNRLRAVRDSDQFESLPDALREKVRQIIADADR